MKALILTLLMAGGAAHAETVVSKAIIRAGTLIAAEDLTTIPGESADAFYNLEELVGLEARAILYPGRPIRSDAVGSPAIVGRNQLVSLKFSTLGLTIVTDGRALTRAGIGEAVEVVNMASHMKITGIVEPDGSVRVGY